MKKADKTIIKRIEAGSVEELNQALENLKTGADVVYLPAILNRFAQGDSQSGALIVQLVSNLKFQEAAPYIVEYIRAQRPNYRLLFPACWQSAIDFSAYLETWVELFEEEDLEPAIELFTIIEDIYTSCGSWTQRKQIVSSLKKLKLDDTKQKLVNHFISESSSDTLELL